MSTFEGRVALVTGGASGIGGDRAAPRRATARRSRCSTAMADGARAVAAESEGRRSCRRARRRRRARRGRLDRRHARRPRHPRQQRRCRRSPPAPHGRRAPVAPDRRREPHRYLPHDGRRDPRDARRGWGRDRQQRVGVGDEPDAQRGGLLRGEGRSDRAHGERCARVRADDSRQLCRTGLHPHRAHRDLGRTSRKRSRRSATRFLWVVSATRKRSPR